MGKKVMWGLGVFFCVCGLIYAADYNLGRSISAKHFNLIGETEDFVSLESSPMIEGNEMFETPREFTEAPTSSWGNSFEDGSCSSGSCSSSSGSCSSGGGSTQSRRMGSGFRPFQRILGLFKGRCR